MCIIIYGILSQKHQLLIQCWFYVGPPSTTLAQHRASIGSTSLVIWLTATGANRYSTAVSDVGPTFKQHWANPYPTLLFWSLTIPTQIVQEQGHKKKSFNRRTILNLNRQNGRMDLRQPQVVCTNKLWYQFFCTAHFLTQGVFFAMFVKVEVKFGK